MRQPSAKNPYNRAAMGRPMRAARSRNVARSGINPVNQNSTDTVKYVDTANTSQSSGERKFGQMAYWLGTGARNHAIHTRPTCRPGYNPAHITAKSVIASAARLTAVRHFWRVRNKMAEISVPAWPMPIQNTKLVMSHAHATGVFSPQTPTPVRIR